MKKWYLFILFFFGIHSANAQWNTDRMLKIGNNALYYEDYVLATQYFNQVIKIKPYLTEPYTQRAIAKISLGDFAGAEQDCNIAIERNPFVPQAYYTRGFARKKLGKLDEATTDFEKALEFSPDNKVIIANLIETKEKNKDYAGAINDIRIYQKIIKDTKGLDFEIGRMQLMQKDTTAAKLSFQKEIDKDSTNPLGYIGSATLKAQMNDMEGALKDFRLLKQKNPDAKGISYEMGRIYLLKNDTTHALEYFGKAIDENSNNVVAYSARALLRMQTNNEKGALEDYNEAIKLKSGFAGDYINRGVLNAKNNKYNLALQDYDKAIKLDAKNSLSFHNRGLLRANLGDKNNALTDFDKVLQIEPNNYEARLQRAILQLDLGLLKGAIADYKIILDKYPFFIPAYYGIADAKKKMGRNTEAHKYLTLATEILNNKDYYRKKQEIYAKTRVDVKLPVQKQETTPNANLIDKLTIDIDTESTANQYGEKSIRGTIQNQPVELEAEGNYLLTYYPTRQSLRHTNTYHPLLTEHNSSNNYYKDLQLTIKEEDVTPEWLNSHFESIALLTKQIEQNPMDAIAYFDRATDFTLVRDFVSALEDLNKAIEINPTFAIAYFMRANVRIMEEPTVAISNTYYDTELNNPLLPDINANTNVKLAMQDYEKAIELRPDFSFSYYNKANLLLEKKDYEQAVEYYSMAIKCNPDFAEAYFNRGICYLLLNNKQNATNDFSKAGELGIYQAYNIIKRLNEN